MMVVLVALTSLEPLLVSTITGTQENTNTKSLPCFCPRYFHPVAQHPGDITVTQQRVVSQVHLLDVCQVAEGSKLNCQKEVVVV